MKFKSRFLLVSLVLLVAMMLSFVSPMTGHVAAQGKTLNVAFAQEPNTLNAFYTQSASLPGQLIWLRPTFSTMTRI
jgi:hypothetical protein